MALKKGDKTNFDTICRAIKADRCALIECKDKRTGKVVAVIAAMSDAGNGEMDMVPLARLHSVDDLNNLQPPNPDGGFHEATPWDPED
jgi:hypothetical protein